MIRYLHRLRGKKGFTMAELIIVIAIMGVLMAMILPMFSSDDAEKQAAETYASDFYASLQYNMTRYQLTEYHLTPQLQELGLQYEDGDSVQPYIYFNKTLGRNVFTMEYLYIEVSYNKGIEYVKIAPNLMALVSDTTTTTSDHPFEKLLENDLEDVMNAADKGHYYAVVRYDYEDPTPSSPNSGDEVGFGDLKVMTAHYCQEALPSTAAGNYKTENLIFTDFSELKCGIICGTCSSDDGNPDPATTTYVGTLGSYFLNINDPTGNAIIEEY